MNIVPTNINYNYKILEENLNKMKNSYPFLTTEVIGKSILKKNLYVIKLGKGPNKVFYSASIHANEWINSVVLMKFIENYCDAYISNSTIYNYSIRNLFNSSSIYILPMNNPDGVDLVTGAISYNSYTYKTTQKIASEFPNIPFPSGWKANIRGVDLNLQFPALWNQAKQIKYSQGFDKPAPRDFVGFGPLTEPESLAIYNFTLANNFRLVIAFHTQGEEIYWNFQNINPPDGYAIGRSFELASGYSLANVPYNSSFAGFKDWFIQDFNHPGYTIETGIGQNPLPISQFEKIYNDNLGILILGAVL
ncbi:MAG: M14 family metallocarboxypeptidase [Clostridia bacterium]|nr:M14 family metallocarboxypeptidase [Clostridia bacterium]